MDHAALKVLLQRRLRDSVADQYDSATVDSFLALGLSQFQALVQDINPDGFGPLTADYGMTAGVDNYPRVPAFKIFRMELLDSVTGKYSEVPPENFEVMMAKEDGSFSPSELRYSEVGTRLFFRPTPDAAYTYRYWYTADLGSQSGWDAYNNLIPLALHSLPVDLALVEALAENAEGVERIERRIAFKVGLIPTLYGRSTKQVSAPPYQPFSSQRSS